MTRERSLCFAAISSLAALLTGGCGSGARDGPLADYNVVVVCVDTLRADHLGFSGYEHDTSPFLDSIANQGVVFERAFSTSSFTRESVSALLTGQLPSISGSRGWNAAPSNAVSDLGELFGRAGYRTGFFSATPTLTNPRFSEDFEVVDQLVSGAGVSGMSHRLSERALEFVAGVGEDRFLMYVHYLDPHGPYSPPEDLLLQYVEEVHPDPVALYTELRHAIPEYVADGFGPGHPRFVDMIARYDAEIADTDRALQSLFAGLDRLGVLENTLVVLTSDHGEEFLEHGFIEHAWTLYDESIHIPLVFWAPGRLDPQRAGHLASHVDIMPTLADLTGLPHDADGFDGRPLFDAEGSVRPSDRPVVCEMLIKHRCVVRATLQGDWKLIQARRWLEPEQRAKISRTEGKFESSARDWPTDFWGEIVWEALYNLRDDPLEQHDLSEERPAKRDELNAILLAHEQRSRAAAPAQQGAHEELDEATQARIRSLGYGGD